MPPAYGLSGRVNSAPAAPVIFTSHQGRGSEARGAAHGSTLSLGAFPVPDGPVPASRFPPLLCAPPFLVPVPSAVGRPHLPGGSPVSTFACSL